MFTRTSIYRTKDEFYRTIKDETEIPDNHLEIAFQAVCESIYQTVKNEVWDGNIKQIEGILSLKKSLHSEHPIVQKVKEKFHQYMKYNSDISHETISYLSELLVVPLVNRTKDMYLEKHPEREVTVP